MTIVATNNDKQYQSFYQNDAGEWVRRVSITGADGNAVGVNESGQMLVVLDGKVSDDNSSNTPLTGDATFQGSSENTLDYAMIFVTAYSDVASATDGLCTETSSDGITWRQSDCYSLPAETEKTFSFQPNKKYFRVNYVNGVSAQTVFDLQTVFKKTNSKASSHRINDTIIAEDDAELVKAVLSAEDHNGDFQNIKATETGSLRVTDFLFEVGRGLIPGYSTMNKFGENPDIDTGTDPEDVWDYGGEYTYSTTADIDTISSSNAGDTQTTTVIGLSADYQEVSQTVVLNGQSKVSLTTPLIRIYRAYNSANTDYAGDVYIYVDGTISGGVPSTAADVRAMIRNGHNQTLMCLYTVPAGKTAYFLGGYVATTKSNATTATFTWRARPYGGVFQVKSKIAVIGSGSSSWQYHYSVPVPLPEKTDIAIKCEEVESNNTGAAGGFDLVLIDNVAPSGWSWKKRYVIDGLTAYCDVSNMAVYDNKSALTLGMLVDFDAASSPVKTIYTCAVGSSPRFEVLRYQTRFYFRVDAGGAYAEHGCTGTSGTYLFTFVYDGSEAAADRLKIYKNNTQLTHVQEAEAPTSTSTGLDNQTTFMARKSTVYAEIDFIDMFLVDGAMTSSEIGDVYNSGDYQNVSDVSSNTVFAHWTFGDDNEDTTTLVKDIVGDNDLTAYNISEGDIV